MAGWLRLARWRASLWVAVAGSRDPICQEPGRHGNIFPVAELVVEGDQLVLRLSWWEKIAAVHGNVRVPLASVSSVHVEARAADALRSPMFKNQSGTGAFIDDGYGVRGYGGGFVALRQRRRLSAVQVHLDPPPSRSMRLSALLVTVANPEATAAHIIDARLDRIRGANPGWDIRKASPPQIGWIAERPGERLHAVPLTKLDALLAKRRDGRRH